MKRFTKNKIGALEFDVPVGLIWAIVVGIVIIGGIVLLSMKGSSGFDYVKNLLNFGATG